MSSSYYEGPRSSLQLSYSNGHYQAKRMHSLAWRRWCPRTRELPTFAIRQSGSVLWTATSIALSAPNGGDLIFSSVCDEGPSSYSFRSSIYD